MPAKVVELPGIGTIYLYKRKGARNLRISVSHEGRIRVTIPTWAPYQAGITFASTKGDWLAANRPPSRTVLANQSRIGKAHVLVFCSDITALQPASRILDNEIRIRYPAGLDATHTSVQELAQKAAVRALRVQAEKLLPPKLTELASLHGYTYSRVTIKQLKSRWGSCDSRGHITLNLFLMQLPWQLIEYVLLHELAHTKFMNHSAEFWNELEHKLPRARQLSNVIKNHRTTVSPL